MDLSTGGKHEWNHHGHWIKIKQDKYYKRATCDYCAQSISIICDEDINIDDYLEYCPFCGAVMD